MGTNITENGNLKCFQHSKVLHPFQMSIELNPSPALSYCTWWGFFHVWNNSSGTPYKCIRGRTEVILVCLIQDGLPLCLRYWCTLHAWRDEFHCSDSLNASGLVCVNTDTTQASDQVFKHWRLRSKVLQACSLMNMSHKGKEEGMGRVFLFQMQNTIKQFTASPFWHVSNYGL